MYVALQRTGCGVLQMECQASNITANVQSDHLLHEYLLPVFSPLINCIVHRSLLKFSPFRNASATSPYRGLVLNTREKNEKDEKFVQFTR